jgi:hypothetical protein
MTKTGMLNALRAFERCKGKLARNRKECGKNSKWQHICFAIGDAPRSFYAKNIVMKSIAPYSTYANWLRNNGSPGLTADEVQRERHRFVDVCITELKRRLKE